MVNSFTIRLVTLVKTWKTENIVVELNGSIGYAI
jgi:hypothetical protein